MKLDAIIRDYYFAHFDEMPFDKRFHFVSRLAAWNNDSQAIEKLESYRLKLAPTREAALEQVFHLYHSPPAMHINSLAARQPYFDTYPELQGLDLALFRLRHLKTIYGIDIVEEFNQVYPVEKLRHIADSLEQDEDALRILSTFAINYIFLTRYILYPSASSVDFVKHVHTIASTVTHKTPEQIQLLIYLYTHCIICDTNFYAQPVCFENVDTFMTMLTELEQIIIDNYSNIHLDNKFEFLVCCRIMDYRPQAVLTNRIYTEAEQSLSNKGDFLIDRHNSFPQQKKVTFSTSEHRNVLFIMSQSAYPHPLQYPNT